MHKNLKLVTLSPVHIGCGEDYLPTNFVIAENALFEFNTPNLINVLSTEELIELGGKSSMKDIQGFFKRKSSRLKTISSNIVLVSQDISKKYEMDAGRNTQNNDINQFQIAKTAYQVLTNQAFIPGSSIKGAIRTAWLNHLNQNKQATDNEINQAKKNNGTSLSRDARLLNYDQKNVEKDPFKQIKVSDSFNLSSQVSKTAIKYAVSKKKRESKRYPAELKVFLETILPFNTNSFNVELNIESLKEKPCFNWESICEACNQFYLPIFKKELDREIPTGKLDPDWKKIINSIVYDELKELVEHKQGFLLRIGKNSGAESLTLEGARHIKIMGKKGALPRYQAETNELRYATDQKSNGFLMPFGWVWVDGCEDAYQATSLSLQQKLIKAAQKDEDNFSEIEQSIMQEKDRLSLAQNRQLKEQQKRNEAQNQLASISGNEKQIQTLLMDIQTFIKSNPNPIQISLTLPKFIIVVEQALKGNWKAEERIQLANMLEIECLPLMKDKKELDKKFKIKELKSK